MIKKLIVMAALLSLVWPTTRAAGILSGLELLERCESDPGERRGSCVGYLLGVAQVMTISEKSGGHQQACIPQGTGITWNQLRLIYIDWAKRNPAELHYGAVFIAKAAIQEAFPCE